MPFVSRAGLKLDHALSHFQIDITDAICADLGANAGGFVDCLLQRGAKKVFAIDTGYGALEWKLRIDSRVVVMERTNALHVSLPEQPSVITIDVAWTKQRLILPSARRLLAPGGSIVALVKPHYEADPNLLRRGVLPAENLRDVIDATRAAIEAIGFIILGEVESPIRGGKGNAEALLHLKPSVE